jgi:hypothetical protein
MLLPELLQLANQLLLVVLVGLMDERTQCRHNSRSSSSDHSAALLSYCSSGSDRSDPPDDLAVS